MSDDKKKPPTLPGEVWRGPIGSGVVFACVTLTPARNWPGALDEEAWEWDTHHQHKWRSPSVFSPRTIFAAWAMHERARAERTEQQLADAMAELRASKDTM